MRAIEYIVPLTMNQLISYDDAAGVLRTPAFPKLARPDFTSVRDGLPPIVSLRLD